MAIAILDIDGTLVDTNYQHTLAWFRAFRRHDIVLALWRIHRHIGMGGDQVVTALCGEEVERKQGDSIREAEGEQYAELIGEVQTPATSPTGGPPRPTSTPPSRRLTSSMPPWSWSTARPGRR